MFHRKLNRPSMTELVSSVIKLSFLYLLTSAEVSADINPIPFEEFTCFLFANGIIDSFKCYATANFPLICALPTAPILLTECVTRLSSSHAAFFNVNASNIVSDLADHCQQAAMRCFPTI